MPSEAKNNGGGEASGQLGKYIDIQITFNKWYQDIQKELDNVLFKWTISAQHPSVPVLLVTNHRSHPSFSFCSSPDTLLHSLLSKVARNGALTFSCYHKIHFHTWKNDRKRTEWMFDKAANSLPENFVRMYLLWYHVQYLVGWIVEASLLLTGIHLSLREEWGFVIKLRVTKEDVLDITIILCVFIPFMFCGFTLNKYVC